MSSHAKNASNCRSTHFLLTKKNPCGGLELLVSSINSFNYGIRCKIAAVKSTRASSFDYRPELISTWHLKKALVQLDLAFSKSKRELVLRENWLE